MSQSPCDATEEPGYIYRVLRRGETPCCLRVPPAASLHLLEQHDLGFRQMVLTSVAFGNGLQASPFLHFSERLQRVVTIWKERGHMYSDFVIRVSTSSLEPESYMSISKPSKRTMIYLILLQLTATDVIN